MQHNRFASHLSSLFDLDVSEVAGVELSLRHLCGLCLAGPQRLPENWVPKSRYLIDTYSTVRVPTIEHRCPSPGYRFSPLLVKCIHEPVHELRSPDVGGVLG